MCYKIYLMVLVLHISLSGRNALKIGVSRQTPTTSTTTTTTTETLTTELTTTSTIPTIITTTSTTTTAATTTTTTTVPATKTEVKKTIFKNLQPPTTTLTTKAPTTKATDNETPSQSFNSISKTVSSTSLTAANYCACDMLPEQCDPNCCCDHNCNAAALLVFNCDKVTLQNHDQLDIKNKYPHALSSCRVSDGWLCVFRTNLLHTQQKQEKMLDFDTTHRYKWPESLVDMKADSEEDQNQQEDEKNFYRAGGMMKIVDVETLEIQEFELPYAFHEPFCSTQEPIYYMQASERTCFVETLEELQENKRKFLEILSQKRILAAPKTRLNKSDLSSNNGLILDWNVRSCLMIGPKENCQDFVDIRNLTESETDMAAPNLYVKDVIITILHNYTNIFACLVMLKEQELTYDEDVKPAYWQTYAVNFVYHNRSSSFEEIVIDFDTLLAVEEQMKAVSGALGYNLCAPVIIARKLITNNDIENGILNYYHKTSNQSRGQHSLRLLAKHRGLCQRTMDPDSLISYGVSALHHCSVILDNKDLHNRQETHKINFTDICVRLQQLASAELLDENLGDWAALPVYVSQLGRPRSTVDDKWLRLQVLNNNFTGNIVGEFFEGSHSFVCRNILLSVAYEFHYGTFDEQGVPHQGLIKQAVLRLGDRHDLEFELNETLEIPLRMSVMFYDLNSSGSMCKCIIINFVFVFTAAIL